MVQTVVPVTTCLRRLCQFFLSVTVQASCVTVLCRNKTKSLSAETVLARVWSASLCSVEQLYVKYSLRNNTNNYTVWLVSARKLFSPPYVWIDMLIPSSLLKHISEYMCCTQVDTCPGTVCEVVVCFKYTAFYLLRRRSGFKIHSRLDSVVDGVLCVYIYVYIYKSL